MQTFLRFVRGVALALAVVGCAHPVSVVSSSPRSVMVSANMYDTANAQAAADAECKKHGRFARMIEQSGPANGYRGFLFDCVN